MTQFFKPTFLLAMFGLMLLSSGCGSTKDRLLDSDQNQVALRQMQSRVFETSDRRATLRAVIATLQDLSFNLSKADEALGTVSGYKIGPYTLHMSVTVRPKGETQMVVRASGQYNLKPVVDPEPYQDFFAALEKSMFLTAQKVD